VMSVRYVPKPPAVDRIFCPPPASPASDYFVKSIIAQSFTVAMH